MAVGLGDLSLLPPEKLGIETVEKTTPVAVPVAERPLPDSLKTTVREFPKTEFDGPAIYTFKIAGVADAIEPWGRFNIQQRDKQLRDFWIQEPFLSGAIYGASASYAAFGWKLVGPKKIAGYVHDILHTANYGKGWVNFIQKLATDLLTQDNGAFVEIIRTELGDPRAPVVGIATLDAARCRRTGVPAFPVIYRDMDGGDHRLAWYQVLTLEDMPSPIEEMYDVQYSAVTRVLRAAQILRDISLFKGEKVGGRFQRIIHIVGGPARQEIKDAMGLQEEEADNQGLLRFMMPTIIASLDPTKPVSHVEIPLASLPDNFDYDQELKWYIAAVASGLGLDYQDLAPLPSGNLGTSQQSQILHMKSRGKGPALFMRKIEHIFNYHGIMPKTVQFEFEQIDLATEKAVADLRIARANRRARMVLSRELTPAASRQLAVDEGDLDEKYLQMMAEQDVTPSDHVMTDSTNMAHDMEEVPPLEDQEFIGEEANSTTSNPLSTQGPNAKREEGPTPRPTSRSQRNSVRRQTP